MQFDDLFTEIGKISPTIDIKRKSLPKLKVINPIIIDPIASNDIDDIIDQIETIPEIEEPEEDNFEIAKQESPKVDNSLLKIDIEDLLRSEGITSVNGKKIKFGNKNLRPANASYGVKNSNHKRRDPHTGNAMARDISIIGGTMNDYAEFRKILLNNQRVRDWMQIKNWGIINELTPAILSRTRGTGPHFHFGPDSWARRTWSKWINSPNINITTAI